ncbi:MAG: chemotaxis protein CheC [Candidatus Omnitrophica bacterium]|nr:chemotaxis protein CheC [Candidatus Omnitrophota bacterium]
MARLNDIQMDALREMGNIGSGNAATALSQMIAEVVDISVPSTEILGLDSIAYALGGPERLMYVIYLEVVREMPGTMLTVFSPETAEFFVRRLLQQKFVSLEDELAQSALREIGSILCGSYLSALSQVVRLSAVGTVPAMACDMLGAILDFILAEIGQVADEVFLMENELYVAEKKLECSQLFLPRPEALRTILSAIGV